MNARPDPTAPVFDRIAVPTPTLLITTVIGIDNSSGRPTGSSQTSAQTRCSEVSSRRERGSLFIS
jgi:hypothetical protein